MALKGRVLTEEHKQKMKEARYKRHGKATCISCDIEFDKYSAESVTCGDKVCVAFRLKQRYEQEKLDDPIRAQARRMVGSLRLVDRVNIVQTMIKEALGSPCKYCGSELDMKNISLDHKEPRHHAKKIPLEEARILDRKDNLHIICRSCNQLKSDMNDTQFETFMDFCDSNPDIGKLLKKRLNFARGRWQYVQSRR